MFSTLARFGFLAAVVLGMAPSFALAVDDDEPLPIDSVTPQLFYDMMMTKDAISFVHMGWAEGSIAVPMNGIKSVTRLNGDKKAGDYEIEGTDCKIVVHLEDSPATASEIDYEATLVSNNCK